jgi:glutathione peroxidase
MTSIKDFSANRIDGSPLSLADLQGKVLLIVNTASACGFTPQFEGLEALHKTYGEQGLVVIGFPCNQFGAQDSGTNEEIGSFCQRNYGVSFLMMEKVDVNGDTSHPLLDGLRHKRRDCWVAKPSNGTSLNS